MGSYGGHGGSQEKRRRYGGTSPAGSRL